MEFILESSEYLQGKDYLTPYEKSVILARLQLKEFTSLEQCKHWINETIQELVESDDPKQEIKEVGKRIL